MDYGPIIHSWNGSRVCAVCTECTVEQYQCKRNSQIKMIWRWWWRHQMETFSALLAICAGNSPVTGEFPAQRPVTRSFDVFFDLHLNKRLSKQSWGWWFETQLLSLWCHCMVSLLSASFQNYFISANAHVSIPHSIVQFMLKIRRLLISMLSSNHNVHYT